MLQSLPSLGIRTFKTRIAGEGGGRRGTREIWSRGSREREEGAARRQRCCGRAGKNEDIEEYKSAEVNGVGGKREIETGANGSLENI